MDKKQEIKHLFGTTKRYAGILGCPEGTPYSHQRTNNKNRRNQSEWQYRANIDCAIYRDRGVACFQCKKCNAIATGDRPNYCSHCNSAEFYPVVVVKTEQKTEEK